MITYTNATDSESCFKSKDSFLPSLHLLLTFLFFILYQNIAYQPIIASQGQSFLLTTCRNWMFEKIWKEGSTVLWGERDGQTHTVTVIRYVPLTVPS